jgi:hypothetical protein
MVQMPPSRVLPGQRFLADKCMTEDSRGLTQALVEQALFSISQKYPYLDRRLALGQSVLPSRFRFLMTRRGPVLSGAKILGEPSVREDGSPCWNQLSL